MYLTKRQRQIFNYINRFIQTRGYAPSLEEIAMANGLSSLATVHKHLKNLEAKGVITRGWNRGRSIQISLSQTPKTVELPLLGEVAAGKPIEAVEDRHSISVPEQFLRSNETFVLRIKGDSMINEQIRDGDYIIVERRSSAQNGETVVALIHGIEATVKKFYRENGKIRLQPANDFMQPTFVNPDDIEIKGIVVGLMRKYP